MNEYMVTVTKDASKSDLCLELCTDGSGVIPRACTCTHEHVLSNRNVQFEFTADEAATLLADGRVLDVVDMVIFNSVEISPHSHYERTINPDFFPTVYSSDDNWGLSRCTQKSPTLGTTQRVSHDGTGVDVVVIDSGVEPNHTEFLDGFGVSRVQLIEWEVGMNAAKPDFYTDQIGHGSHVMGTVAGNTQGWAIGARLHAMKIFNTDAYDVLTALGLVRAWHNAKSGPDAGRPTVINNSWGSSRAYPSNHPTKPNEKHPVQVTATDAEIESMITDGIIWVASAGNDAHFVANAADTANYDALYYMDASLNWLPSSAGASYFQYFNRVTPGGSGDPDQICVAATGNYLATNHQLVADYTNRGTGITVFAPGTYIQSTDKDVEVLLHGDGANASTTFIDNGVKKRTINAFGNAQLSNTQSKFGGTSMYFDGSAGTRIEIPSDDVLNLAERQFTLDFWIFVNSWGSGSTILSKRSVAGATSYSPILIENDKLYVSTTGTSWDVFNGYSLGIPLSTWTHVVIEHIGAQIGYFKNGTVTATAAITTPLLSNTEPFRIGGDSDGSNADVYIDEFRLINGTALYGNSFTLANQQYRALTKKSGTSMASPQVAGMIALLLEAHPTFTQADVVAWINKYATVGDVDETTAPHILEGSPNKLMYSVFNGVSTRDATDWSAIINPVANNLGTWTTVEETWIKTGGEWVKTFG